MFKWAGLCNCYRPSKHGVVECTILVNGRCDKTVCNAQLENIGEILLCTSHDSIEFKGWHQGRNRHIFLRGKVIFPDFFPCVKCFFPVENSHFGRSQFRSRSSPLFITFPTSISNFPSSLLQFSFFSHVFPFFLASFFPKCQQKISGQKSGGHSAPRLLRHWVTFLKSFQGRHTLFWFRAHKIESCQPNNN